MRRSSVEGWFCAKEPVTKDCLVLNKNISVN